MPEAADSDQPPSPRSCAPASTGPNPWCGWRATPTAPRLLRLPKLGGGVAEGNSEDQEHEGADAAATTARRQSRTARPSPEQRRAQAWVDDLTDDELEELQRNAADAGRSNLRAELAAYARAAGELNG